MSLKYKKIFLELRNKKRRLEKSGNLLKQKGRI